MTKTTKKWTAILNCLKKHRNSGVCSKAAMDHAIKHCLLLKRAKCPAPRRALPDIDGVVIVEWKDFYWAYTKDGPMNEGLQWLWGDMGYRWRID